MSDTMIEERFEALEGCVYDLIHKVNELKEQSEVIDVVTMVNRLKDYREMERFLDTHRRVVAMIKEAKL